MKRTKTLIITLASTLMCLLIVSCFGNSYNHKDNRCPELVDAAEDINSRTEKTDITVEYVDSVYRMIQYMDDSKAERYSASLGNQKLFLYNQFILSKNSVHRLLVENKVYFEFIIKNKSGDVISRTILTPYELTNAMDGVPFSNLRCLELEKEANYHNSKAKNLKGMTVKVEFLDSIYRITQTVDEKIIPKEKVIISYCNEKSNMIASLSSSKDKEREHYNLMVDYNVTFEHIVKSKQTGNILVRTVMKPNEIADALKNKLTKSDQLKISANNIKRTLPRIMETGYTMNNISCTDDVVNIEIIIDENLKSFKEATKIRNWPRSEQAVTLGDLTVGLAFWSVAAQVPMGFDFHFIGSKGNNELHIGFSKDEVVDYNEVMNKIKDQQFK